MCNWHRLRGAAHNASDTPQPSHANRQLHRLSDTPASSARQVASATVTAAGALGDAAVATGRWLDENKGTIALGASIVAITVGTGGLGSTVAFGAAMGFGAWDAADSCMSGDGVGCAIGVAAVATGGVAKGLRLGGRGLVSLGDDLAAKGAAAGRAGRAAGAARGARLGESIAGPLRSIPILGPRLTSTATSTLANLGGSIGSVRGWALRATGSLAQSAGLRLDVAGRAFEYNSLFWSAGSVSGSYGLGGVLE